MAAPDVPYRFEYELEVRATPTQVWEAIASAEGISAWMVPAELEPRPGGAVVFHMGPEPDMASHGRVTDFEPSHRIVYEEDWAGLAGQDGSGTTPLVTEFLVEARSGGTCVVRVVTSAYGVGAEWEQEFFDEMGRGWAPMLDNLRLYLTHFPGQRVTSMAADTAVDAPPGTALDAVRAALGVRAAGDAVDVLGLRGRIERSLEHHLLVHLDPPIAGLLSIHSFGTEGESVVHLLGYLFADDAPQYADRNQPEWQQWLAGAAAAATASAQADRRPG